MVAQSVVLCQMLVAGYPQLFSDVLHFDTLLGCVSVLRFSVDCLLNLSYYSDVPMRFFRRALIIIYFGIH